MVAYPCFDSEKVGARSLLEPVAQPRLKTCSGTLLRYARVNSQVVEDFEVKSTLSLRPDRPFEPLFANY